MNVLHHRVLPGVLLSRVVVSIHIIGTCAHCSIIPFVCALLSGLGMFLRTFSDTVFGFRASLSLSLLACRTQSLLAAKENLTHRRSLLSLSLSVTPMRRELEGQSMAMVARR